MISNRIINIVKATKKQPSITTGKTPRIESSSEQNLTSPRQKYSVFISHCKHDSDFAELIKLRLEKEGVPVWIDNDRLEPGIDWKQEIDEAIKIANTLIVIMSPEARESEYVTYEWSFALGCDIRIVPVMLRETSLHPRLATLNYIDFTNFRVRPWDKLIDYINRTKKPIKIIKKN